MQPEWLTSTVTALARSFAPPRSHSTRSFTREMMRLWLRSLSHRSCSAMSEGWGAMLMAMADLAGKELPGPRGANPTLAPEIAQVNSTFSATPSGSIAPRNALLWGTNKKAGRGVNRAGPFNLIPAVTYVPTQLPVQYHRPGEA